MTDADGGKKWGKMIKYQCVISPSEVDILSWCPFLELIAPVGLKINSLLPLGRYIDMDPSTTELVVSQTQFIRFGQFLLG